VDIPTYSVFKDQADDLTYIAYNAGSESRLVNFSDGFSMTVDQKEMKTFSTSNQDPNAPIAILLSSRTSGKVPLTVELIGSNSFDPNGSQLSYFWNFGDGETSDIADPTHVFTAPGNYTVILTVTNDLNLSTKDSVMIKVLGNGTPYLGTAFTIPGIVQAEFYDLGGEGVAYHDNEAANLGVPFRSAEGVDIEASNDPGGGYNIGWIEDGEWVEYTINVPSDGMYSVIPRIASVPGGGSLHIEFNGIDLTGNINVPITGGWQFWQSLFIPDIYLNAGEQVMHVGFHNGQFNLNWIEILASTTDINESQESPSSFQLSQNYPNPFNPTTNISFTLPRAEHVSLKVYNLLGQEVALLVNEIMSAGNFDISFDAAELPTGIYVYSITAGNFKSVKKMMILK
jgi:PKD repeat protein